MLTCLKQKQVLDCHGQGVQCKIKSLRKLPNVKGESPATAKDYPLPTTVSKASKAQSVPGHKISI